MPLLGALGNTFFSLPQFCHDFKVILPKFIGYTMFKISDNAYP